MNSPPALTLTVVKRLYAIFARLGWHGSPDNENGNRLFNAFCSLLERLDSIEQELILTLTSEFLHCKVGSYPDLIVKACDAIDSSMLGANSEVLVVPLTQPGDARHAKSGGTVGYLFKEAAQNLQAFSGKTLTTLNHVAGLHHSDHSARVNATILFVDDYIGTGETATKALDEYESDVKRPDDTVLAVSLVAQRNGLDILKGRVPNSFAAIVRDRGISDSATIVEKNVALQTMRAIEQRLRVEAKFRLGYQGSEGLEKMIRTPDNTFPIFWHRGGDSNNPWPAPFPRK
jgi:hypothetical protein